jgi:hypothetical protein
LKHLSQHFQVNPWYSIISGSPDVFGGGFCNLVVVGVGVEGGSVDLVMKAWRNPYCPFRVDNWDCRLEILAVRAKTWGSTHLSRGLNCWFCCIPRLIYLVVLTWFSTTASSVISVESNDESKNSSLEASIQPWKTVRKCWKLGVSFLWWVYE